MSDACYHRGARHFFRGSRIWELKDLFSHNTKTGWGEELILPPGKKSHGLCTQQESCKKVVHLQRFWVKEPRHSEKKKNAQKCYQVPRTPYLMSRQKSLKKKGASLPH